jgi:hypothetical protein
MKRNGMLVALASETQAFCRVVTPDDPRWRDLGHKFCVRVREYTRTEPQQVTPDELVEEDTSRYNLVLFGSILNNPAMLKVYARGRCFTDASYPGREGAEIRTLLNPLGTGRDVVLIGGSDYASVHEAAIGLNRTFTDVSSEVDGVLCLHRLNFCVSPDHHVPGPVAGEVQRALDIVEGDSAASIAAATTFALNHYRSDDPAWADAFVRALRPALAAGGQALNVGRLALAWGLVHAFPGYDPGFRADVDGFLTRAGQAAGARLRACDEDTRLTDAADDWLSLIRVADHIESAIGERPWPEEESVAWRTLMRPDPGVCADGLRDWRAIDIWLGAALRAERYDLLDTDVLRSLTVEAAAERDNLGASVGDATGSEHVANVLRKIAAYEDDGEPLWLRRWMQDAAPSGATASTAGWFTGAYAPDRAPAPARDIPRVNVLPAASAREGARLVAMRRDFDAGGEYVAFRGERLALCRLTWHGHTWFSRESHVASSASATTSYDIVQADMDGLAYVSAADPQEGWSRQIVWRHGAFLAICDGAPATEGVHDLPVAQGVVREGSAAAGGEILRSGMSAIGVTQLSTPGGSAGMDGRTVSIIALGGSHAAASDGGPRSFAIGSATCHLGDAGADGARVRAACTVLDDDAVWSVDFEGVEVDGRALLASSSPVRLHLRPSRESGRVQVHSPCRLAWNDGADGIDLDAGEYDVQFHDFDWAGLARLSLA